MENRSDGIELKERILEQNTARLIAPAIGVEFGNYVKGVRAVEGRNLRFNIRKGLDLSVYDLQFHNETHHHVTSEPCVAITILLEADGEGRIKIPNHDRILSTVPHKSGMTYICFMDKPLAAYTYIPRATVIKGIDIRLSHEFVERLTGFPAMKRLNSSHPLHYGSSPEFWLGVLPSPGKILQHTQKIFADVAQNKNDDLTMEAHALNVLSDMKTMLSAQDPHGNTATLTPGDKRKLSRVRDLMLQDLSHPWTIAGLARNAGLNEGKLKSGFRCEFDIPVYGFLQRERLHHARQLLEQEKVSVTEASLAVGYANPSHFAYLFRREYGCPPSKIKFQK